MQAKARRFKMSPQIGKGGYVYLLKIGEFYKIGRAKDVATRVKRIQASIPWEIEVVEMLYVSHASSYEASLFKKFSEFRVRGEWFIFPPQTLREVISYLLQI